MTDASTYNQFWAWFATQSGYHRELVPAVFGRFTIEEVPISQLCSLAELQAAYTQDGAIGMWLLAKAVEERMTEDHFCTRCGEPLDPTKLVWLELNTNTGHYATAGEVPEDKSQGLFTFGAACAKRVLKAGGVCDYRPKKTFRK